MPAPNPATQPLTLVDVENDRRIIGDNMPATDRIRGIVRDELVRSLRKLADDLESESIADSSGESTSLQAADVNIAE